MGGGSLVKIFKGYGLAVGIKETYSGVPVETPFEKMLWMKFLLKEVNIG